LALAEEAPFGLQSRTSCVRISYMKSTATLKLKMTVEPDADAALTATQAAYVTALNTTSAVAFERTCFNAVALHHLTYKDVRAATGLPANLVCSARAIVAEAYKRDNTRQHKWKDGAAVRYDARTLTLKLAECAATLTTLQGRVKAAFKIAPFHRQYLNSGWGVLPTATLCRRKSNWYLHIVVEKDIPDAEGSGVLGVDSGIKRIATTSEGATFKGGAITQLRRRRFRQRRSLQTRSEGQSKSRNQRRLLHRLSGQEKRAVDWKLWNVANEIVREAVATACATIAIEDLKGIRSRIRVAKRQRLIQYGWPFASLFAKMRHVAGKHGIAVVEVEARNTSRTCNRCGHCTKENRQSQSGFRCASCLHSLNADFMASLNIRDRCVGLGCAAVTPRLMSVATLAHAVA
jgi:IS605 OrfB family transposase